MMDKMEIEIKAEKDIILARRAGREMARALGFGLADQTRLATAISELARNVIQYADHGTCTISSQLNQKFMKIQVVVEDHGPGIADIEKALEYKFSTGKGLGAGLPGTKRLVHKLEIESEPGHTKITIEMHRKKLSS